MFRRSHTISEGENARTLDKQLAFIEFDPSGTILRANEIFLEVMGYTAAEIVGRHHRMFVDPAHASSPQYTEFWRALGSGQASSGEYPRRRKDGTVIWIQGCYAPVRNKKGQVIRVVKQAADITERKELELRNQSVLCSLESAQAVIEFDPSGRILRANPNFLGAVGYTSDEIVGRHHSIFMPAGEANKQEYKQFWEDLRQGKPQQGEFERAGKGGRPVHIQAIYTPIFSADGTVNRVVKFADDITTQVMSRQTGEMADRLARDLADLAAASTQVNQSVGDTADLSQSLVAVTTGLRTEIADLGVESQKINAVIDLIRSLSDQTNLLALNATVEAVRAGEAGLGFNVVASEVKKLASETNEALATISTQVDGILSKVEGVAKTIDGVHQDSEQVGGNAQEVAAAMEQQTRIIGQLHESSQALLSD